LEWHFVFTPLHLTQVDPLLDFWLRSFRLPFVLGSPFFYILTIFFECSLLRVPLFSPPSFHFALALSARIECPNPSPPVLLHETCWTANPREGHFCHNPPLPSGRLPGMGFCFTHYVLLQPGPPLVQSCLLKKPGGFERFHLLFFFPCPIISLTKKRDFDLRPPYERIRQHTMFCSPPPFLPLGWGKKWMGPSRHPRG